MNPTLRVFTLAVAIGLLSVMLPIRAGHAFSNFGTTVDSACLAFNGTTPFADQGCSLCHSADFATAVQPQWNDWQSNNLTAFCPEPSNLAPQGSIDAPTGNTTISVGETVNFMGSGNDPDGDTPLSFLWDFDGAAANAMVEDPGDITFSTAGVFNVSLSVTDSLGLSDPTPATRTITVQPPLGQCTDLDMDGYAVEGGACGPADCNDSDPALNPGADEICNDGIDNNCNNLIDLADPLALACPIGCSDQDGDRFSPEGGICGPIDCNDLAADINPAMSEACGDAVDNDCDGQVDGADSECQAGGDCVGDLFLAPVNISEAEWDARERELKVEGNQATAGADVTLRNLDTGAVLGMTMVRTSGKWEFEIRINDAMAVPCRVQVEIGNRLAQIEVADAPSHCNGGAGDDEDDERDSDGAHGDDRDRDHDRDRDSDRDNDRNNDRGNDAARNDRDNNANRENSSDDRNVSATELGQNQDSGGGLFDVVSLLLGLLWAGLRRARPMVNNGRG